MKRLRVACFIFMLAGIGVGVFSWYTGDHGTNDDAPVVSVDDQVLQVSVKDDQQSYLQGVTATDKKDGDVTDSLVIESVTDFTDDMQRLVTIAAFDSDHNVGKAERRIQYTDYVAPEFILESPLIFTTSDGDLDYTDIFGAQDSMDGDISSSILISDGYYFTIYNTGEFQSQIQVTNSLGDTEILPFTYTVYEQSVYNQMPHITLTDYLVYTTVGQTLDFSSYLEQISGAVDTNDLEDVEIDTSGVDLNTPGTYQVSYSLTNEDDVTGTTDLIVVVR